MWQGRKKLVRVSCPKMHALSAPGSWSSLGDLGRTAQEPTSCDIFLSSI